ncbi:MAG: hypothetical protein IJJ56_02520 [Prevotella sp.]|nr:hypothetical protein [Prevotella sp.]MBR0165901.1 hypothetical protein [Prevotella sp.]
MLELNIFLSNKQNSQTLGKYYARVESKQTLSIQDMAKHMAEHNTPFSKGTIEGILRDFVACVREQCLNGNTVKIDDLAIFKCAISANGLQLRENFKVNCGLGTLPKTGPDGTGLPDFTLQTQPAVSTVRLLAQATGEFTMKELNDDSTFRWTKAAAEKIESLVKPTSNQGGGE